MRTEYIFRNKIRFIFTREDQLSQYTPYMCKIHIIIQDFVTGVIICDILTNEKIFMGILGMMYDLEFDMGSIYNDNFYTIPDSFNTIYTFSLNNFYYENPLEDDYIQFTITKHYNGLYSIIYTDIWNEYELEDFIMKGLELIEDLNLRDISSSLLVDYMEEY